MDNLPDINHSAIASYDLVIKSTNVESLTGFSNSSSFKQICLNILEDETKEVDLPKEIYLYSLHIGKTDKIGKFEWLTVVHFLDMYGAVPMDKRNSIIFQGVLFK